MKTDDLLAFLWGVQHGLKRAKHDFRAFVKKVSRKPSRTSNVIRIHFSKNEILFKSFRQSDVVSGWRYDGGASPEIHAVFKPHSVAKQHVHIQQACITSMMLMVDFLRFEFLAVVPDTRGTCGKAEDCFGSIDSQEIRQRHMPQVFTNQYSKPAEFGIERPRTISRAEIPAFLEHTVCRGIHFSVDMLDFAVFQKQGTVVNPMLGAAFDKTKDDGN